MPYHIKSVGSMGSGDIYYQDGNRWTGTYADRKQYSNKSDADAQAAESITRTIKNSSGVVVKTYTYKTKEFANASVITE